VCLSALGDQLPRGEPWQYFTRPFALGLPAGAPGNPLPLARLRFWVGYYLTVLESRGRGRKKGRGGEGGRRKPPSPPPPLLPTAPPDEPCTHFFLCLYRFPLTPTYGFIGKWVRPFGSWLLPGDRRAAQGAAAHPQKFAVAEASSRTHRRPALHGGLLRGGAGHGTVRSN
jgi:hypothetical protein